MKRLLCGLAALSLLLGGVGQARADLITTPARISPGGQFIVVFVDSNNNSLGTSTSISTYNSNIQTDAAGITYNGTISSWSVLGATDTTNNATALLQSTLPIYDTASGGTLLASSGSTLLAATIDIDQNGNLTSESGVWTGLTATTGATATGDALGDANATQGDNNSALDVHGLDRITAGTGAPNELYGYAIFTAPSATTTPEPATLTLLGIGIASMAVYGWRQRKLAASQPTECPTAHS